MIWFLLVIIIFWQPIFWAGRAIYHFAKRDTWDAQGYWLATKDWFKILWGLIAPSKGSL